MQNIDEFYVDVLYQILLKKIVKWIFFIFSYKLLGYGKNNIYEQKQTIK